MDDCSQAPPPSCDVEMFVLEAQGTAPYLHHPVPVKGIDPERQLSILRWLQTSESSGNISRIMYTRTSL